VLCISVGSSSTVQLTDRPWSPYFCCILAGNRDYVSEYPVATKRVLRAAGTDNGPRAGGRTWGDDGAGHYSVATPICQSEAGVTSLGSRRDLLHLLISRRCRSGAARCAECSPHPANSACVPFSRTLPLLYSDLDAKERSECRGAVGFFTIAEVRSGTEETIN
jgi:hypothetical protein